MKSYNEIFKRILEIIKLSDDIKSKHSLSHKHFITINHFQIYKDYVDEFREMLDSERTIFLLNQDKQNSNNKKNYELIKLCRLKIQNEKVHRNEYLRLHEILVSSFNHSALDLIEHSGFYILKDLYEEFIMLCQLLKVGPSVFSVESNKDEIRVSILASINNNKTQYQRIKKYYDTLVLKIDEPNDEIDLNYKPEDLIEIPEQVIEQVTKNTENIVEDVVELKTEEKIEGKMQSLTCDFKEIIFLGMNGLLNVEMIVQLKSVLDKEEFKKLLALLAQYQIFDDKTILEIKRRLVTKFKVITDINELVAYFAVRRGINIDSLKALIPSIGEQNYHYLIDELYRYGTIDIFDYKKYLEENNLIGNEIIKK